MKLNNYKVHFKDGFILIVYAYGITGAYNTAMAQERNREIDLIFCADNETTYSNFTLKYVAEVSEKPHTTN